MPDESCRTCGGELINHKSCSTCRKPIQKICKTCNNVARLQYHQHDVNNVNLQKPVQTIPKSSYVKKNSFHFSLAAVGIIGFLILGLAATYSNVPQVIPDEAQATTNNEIKVASNFPIASSQSYDNCLAYGSGESITVTCPTDSGTVYKGILNMPPDLKKGFDSTVFSIRGISVTENHDGSVVLHYHLKQYLASYFGS